MMREFRRRLLIFGYPLLEIATVYVVAQLIGWGWTFLLLLIGIPAGFALMRNAGAAALRDARAAQATRSPVDASRHALSFVGGVLVAIPGFWTDIIGLLLVIPLTQRLFRSRADVWFDGRLTSVRMPGIRFPGEGEVIQGTVVYPDDDPGPDEPPTPTTRPELP